MMPMGLCRRHRTLAAFCAAFALVYAHLLFSGYSCAMLGFGGDLESPTLCQLHCDYDQQTVDIAKPAPQPLHASPAAVRIAVPEALPVTARIVRGHRAAPGPAPPLIRSTVLRI